MFSRRKISLESFNTSPSDVPNIYRFTIVILESEAVVKNLVKQIEKIVDVFKVYCNTNEEIVWQQMALYKVPTEVIIKEVKVERLLREYGAKAVVIRSDYTVFEATGQGDEINKLLAENNIIYQNNSFRNNPFLPEPVKNFFESLIVVDLTREGWLNILLDEAIQKCNNEMRLFSKSRTISCDEFRKRIKKDDYIDNVSLIIFNENLSKAISDTAKRYDELVMKKSKEADRIEAKKLLNNVTLMQSRMKDFNDQLSEFNLRNQ
jgi:acetolactate synthase small subunit